MKKIILLTGFFVFIISNVAFAQYPSDDPTIEEIVVTAVATGNSGGIPYFVSGRAVGYVSGSGSNSIRAIEERARNRAITRARSIHGGHPRISQVFRNRKPRGGTHRR